MGADDSAHSRSACTECQRRKQKCNRVWPCNHCQKRKVADKCRFTSTVSAPDKTPSHDVSRKRQLSHDDIADSSDVNPWDDGESGFEALGYDPVHLFSGLGTSERRAASAAKQHRQFEIDAHSCPQLQRALEALPSRLCTDSLVQNFLDNVNYHYYIIYPPSFLDNYQSWWGSRDAQKPLGLQWTCLLLMICACSAQYTDVELQLKLEQDLGETTQQLTEKYHTAARELHSVIPVGNNHLFNVQSLLHSCYWYTSEARFVESWHVLSTAIREAQELGIHQESVSGPLAEFDREMRRRLWCILDTWDWQISALLSRPMIIDRSECHVGLPSLKLEGYSPSPLMPMKLQSELITQLSRRFRFPKHITSPADVREYQAIIETWMAGFPPSYDFDEPDRGADTLRPWIVLHRHYLHTMSLSMLLDPIRAYLAKPMTARSPPDELCIRSDGINYCLRLMDALYGFFNHAYPRDAKFHFVLFCIFDTAAVLCSVLMHDEDFSIPDRSRMIDAVDEAVAMLKRLNTVTKTAKDAYEILIRVSQRVKSHATMPPPYMALGGASRRRSGQAVGLVMTPPGGQHADYSVGSDAGSVESYGTYGSMSLNQGIAVSHTPSPHSISSADGLCSLAPVVRPAGSPHGSAGLDGSVGLAMSPVSLRSGFEYAQSAPYLNMTPPLDDMYQPIEFGNITQQDLGELATLWNYESLNLQFINPQS